MTVLIASASRHGATHEIARAIAQELDAGGLEVRVEDVAAVDGVDGFDAVILGSAVYMGRWLDPARRFAERNAQALAARPTWLFSSGPIGEPPRPDEDDAVDVGALMQATAARGHALFAGRLDRHRLGFGERAVVAALRVPDGDFRDWSEIRGWARGVLAELKG